MVQVNTTSVLVLGRSDGFEHGTDRWSEAQLTQTGIADPCIEDAGAWSVMVLPNNRGKTFLITKGIGELAARVLHVVNKVVNPLKTASIGEINASDDVLKMHPSIDVIAILGHALT